MYASSELDYACSALAKKLGLDRPVPPAVLLRARDPEFLERLLASAHDLPRLEPLLASESEPRATPQLVSAALKAFWKWAGTRFGVVPGDVYGRRISACESCPFYGPPPHKAAYAVAALWTGDTRICSRCGCVTSVKARLPKQSCPSRDPEDPNKSRWGEPYE